MANIQYDSKFTDQGMRWDIIVNTRKLKDSTNDDIKWIYVRRDMNPHNRTELARLKEVVNREKAKPENVGRNITLDYKWTRVFVDDLEIDHYNEQCF